MTTASSGGKPCIRGSHVAVATVVGMLVPDGVTKRSWREYPYLEATDIAEALSFAAWRVQEVDLDLADKVMRILDTRL